MPRFFIIVLILLQSTVANPFEGNCLQCHFAKQQLHMFINRYTLQYSSEAKIKEAIKNYLQNPSKSKSVMPLGFLTRFGIKKKTTLTPKQLEKAINIYYKRYNLLQKIE